MSAAIKTIAETHSVLPTFGETADAILQRELKYVTARPRETTSGDFVGVLNYNTDWIKFIDERAMVQYALTTFLFTHGKRNEDGMPKMFEPVIVPFHVNDAGEPVTQLRVFFYREAAQAGERMKPSTIFVRCEPINTHVKFDIEKLAQASM
jgi:hypothetical protein